jgi:cytochrome c oxidase assembly protein subunit 11
MAAVASAPAGRLRLVLLLAVLPLAMLALGFFVFPRFYGLWCQITGTGYSPNNPATDAAPAHGRTVEVFFQAQVFDNLPVRFYPDRRVVAVTPGADADNIYHFQNLSSRPLRFRPVHQLSPTQASEHFQLKVCFCFNDQEIGPGETRDFPVRFTFAPALDERIRTATVCYSLFPIAAGAKPSAGQEKVRAQVESAKEGGR